MTIAASTPAETDLPLIISVDDHILEPRDLWQEELPASDARPRPAGRARAGAAATSPAATTASPATPPTASGATCGCSTTWCCPPACCTRPAGVPKDRQEQHPRRLRGLPARHLRPEGPPGRHGRQPRRGAAQLPQHVPALRRAGLRRARRQGARRCAASQIYNDWMIDEWCGGDGRGRLIPLTLVPLWDPHGRGRRGAPLRGQGQLRHRLHREPGQARLPLALLRRVGSCCGTPAPRPTPPCRCTSARRRPCPPPAPTRRWPPRWPSARRTPRARCATGCSPARSRASRAQARVRREPDRLDAVPARADGPGGREEAAGGVDLDRPPERDRPRAGVGLHLRRPARPQQPRRGRPRAHPVRDRLPARRRHLARTRGRWPTACAPAPGMDAAECAQFLRGNAIGCYGLERFGITA